MVCKRPFCFSSLFLIKPVCGPRTSCRTDQAHSPSCACVCVCIRECVCAHSCILREAGQLGLPEEEFPWGSWESCLAPPSPSCFQTFRRRSSLLLFVFLSLPSCFLITFLYLVAGHLQCAWGQCWVRCWMLGLGGPGLSSCWVCFLACWAAAGHKPTPELLWIKSGLEGGA